jgi:hypothetical protein
MGKIASGPTTRHARIGDIQPTSKAWEDWASRDTIDKVRSLTPNTIKEFLDSMSKRDINRLCPEFIGYTKEQVVDFVLAHMEVVK